MTWIVDLLFVLILLGGIFLGANRGFVKSIAKFAGTLFAIIFAVTFAISLSNALENWFGMTTALFNWIGSWFTAPEYTVSFDRTMTGADLADALSSINGIARAIILQSFGTAEVIPPIGNAWAVVGTDARRLVKCCNQFYYLICDHKIRRLSSCQRNGFAGREACIFPNSQSNARRFVRTYKIDVDRFDFNYDLHLASDRCIAYLSFGFGVCWSNL